MPRTGTTGYDPVLKFLHWLTLALIVSAFVLANAIDVVPDGMKENVRNCIAPSD